MLTPVAIGADSLLVSGTAASQTSSLRGSVVVCLIDGGICVMAADTMVRNDDNPAHIEHEQKVVEFSDLLAGFAGIGRSDDGTVNPAAAVRAEYRAGISLNDLAASLVTRLRAPLESLLTRRIHEVAAR